METWFFFFFLMFAHVRIRKNSANYLLRIIGKGDGMRKGPKITCRIDVDGLIWKAVRRDRQEWDVCGLRWGDGNETNGNGKQRTISRWKIGIISIWRVVGSIFKLDIRFIHAIATHPMVYMFPVSSWTN